MLQDIPPKSQLLLQEDVRLSYILCRICQSCVEVSHFLGSVKCLKVPVFRNCIESIHHTVTSTSDLTLYSMENQQTSLMKWTARVSYTNSTYSYSSSCPNRPHKLKAVSKECVMWNNLALWMKTRKQGSPFPGFFSTRFYSNQC